MRPPKRQWRDEHGVVHELFVFAKARPDKAMPLMCHGKTSPPWTPIRDAPTCLTCVAGARLVRLSP